MTDPIEAKIFGITATDKDVVIQLSFAGGNAAFSLTTEDRANLLAAIIGLSKKDMKLVSEDNSNDRGITTRIICQDALLKPYIRGEGRLAGLDLQLKLLDRFWLRFVIPESLVSGFKENMRCFLEDEKNVLSLSPYRKTSS